MIQNRQRNLLSRGNNKLTQRQQEYLDANFPVNEMIAQMRFPTRFAVQMNGRKYDARTLWRWLSTTPVIPHSRRVVTSSNLKLITEKALQLPHFTNTSNRGFNNYIFRPDDNRVRPVPQDRVVLAPQFRQVFWAFLEHKKMILGGLSSQENPKWILMKVDLPTRLFEIRTWVSGRYQSALKLFDAGVLVRRGYGGG